MNNIELTNRLVDCLTSKLRAARGKPRQFTPKELAAEIAGAYPPAVGSVADQVVAILQRDGWKIRYDKSKNPRRFLLNL
jgi:hypothetical protein